MSERVTWIDVGPLDRIERTPLHTQAQIDSAYVTAQLLTADEVAVSRFTSEEWSAEASVLMPALGTDPILGRDGAAARRALVVSYASRCPPLDDRRRFRLDLRSLRDADDSSSLAPSTELIRRCAELRAPQERFERVHPRDAVALPTMFELLIPRMARVDGLLAFAAITHALVIGRPESFPGLRALKRKPATRGAAEDELHATIIAQPEVRA